MLTHTPAVGVGGSGRIRTCGGVTLGRLAGGYLSPLSHASWSLVGESDPVSRATRAACGHHTRLVPSAGLEPATRGFTGRYPRPGVSMGHLHSSGLIHSCCEYGRLGWSLGLEPRAPASQASMLTPTLRSPGALGGSRTPTGLRPPRSERGSYTSFNTSAGIDTGVRTPATTLRGWRASATQYRLV